MHPSSKIFHFFLILFLLPLYDITYIISFFIKRTVIQLFVILTEGKSCCFIPDLQSETYSKTSHMKLVFLSLPLQSCPRPCCGSQQYGHVNCAVCSSASKVIIFSTLPSYASSQPQIMGMKSL